MNFFKDKTDFEKKSIIISLSFTFLIHIAIIILLSQVAKAETIETTPIAIEARILKKGKKDGINSKNSKNKDVRTKKKNFLPDKTEKKREKKREKKKEKIKNKKKIDKDVVKLKKDIDKKNKKDKVTSKRKDKEDVSSDLLASLNSINPSLPDNKKTSKKGGLGSAKGDVNGFEDGNETDPNKTIAGSLYERRIAIKIKKRWKHPPLENRKGISVTIRLFINLDGTIRFKIIKKSDNRFFNDSISRVLNSIKKVEKPADSFKKYYQKNGIQINFFPKE